MENKGRERIKVNIKKIGRSKSWQERDNYKREIREGIIKKRNEIKEGDNKYNKERR